MNIPIYRAKKIDSDEYVIGYCEYIPNDGRSINTINSGCWISWIKLDNKGFRDRFEVEIDPTTLAIHFSDMLDSQGNKIFASLSNTGGSILTDGVCEFNLYFDGRKYRIIGNEINSEINDYEEWKDFKAIGIQE